VDSTEGPTLPPVDGSSPERGATLETSAAITLPDERRLSGPGSKEHHGWMSQPRPEQQDDYEGWRDLQAVLEERDREWWAEQDTDEDA
jgi:hypothetical protein